VIFKSSSRKSHSGKRNAYQEDYCDMSVDTITQCLYSHTKNTCFRDIHNGKTVAM